MSSITSTTSGLGQIPKGVPSSSHKRGSAGGPGPTESNGNTSGVQVDTVKIIEDDNPYIPKPFNRKIDYELRYDTKEVVVKVVDAETGEVVRQIPDEEHLRLVQKIEAVYTKFFMNRT